MGNELARKVPTDNEAEMPLLGALLRDANYNLELIPLLEDRLFTTEPNKTVCKAILDCFGDGIPVDSVTVTENLMADILANNLDAGYLVDLMESVPSPQHAEHYLEIVIERTKRRVIREAGIELNAGAGDYAKDTDEVLQSLYKKLEELPSRKEGNKDIHLADTLNEGLDEVQAAKKKDNGLLTGFPDLDAIIGGFHLGELILIAGRPGMGKSSFALNLARHLAEVGTPIAFFSFEVSRTQVGKNLMACASKTNAKNLRDGMLSAQDFQSLTEQLGPLASLPIYIRDPSLMKVMELKAELAKLIRSKNVKVVFVDYLQLMDAGIKTENREKEIAFISRNLKAMAKEFKVAMVALSQLSRSVEGRQDKRPMLSDLRESGTLEQDADIVMFLYSEGYYKQDGANGEIEISVAKQRHGPVARVRLMFNRSCLRFENLAREEHQEFHN